MSDRYTQSHLTETPHTTGIQMITHKIGNFMNHSDTHQTEAHSKSEIHRAAQQDRMQKNDNDKSVQNCHSEQSSQKT